MTEPLFCGSINFEPFKRDLSLENVDLLLVILNLKDADFTGDGLFSQSRWQIPWSYFARADSLPLQIHHR